MAKRYSRNLNVENGSDEEAANAVRGFISRLDGKIKAHFAGAGWLRAGLCDGSGMQIQLSNGTFQGRLEAKRIADVVLIPGQGPVRKKFLLVSAESSNAKRKAGRETELNLQHASAAFFGFIGGCILSIPWAIYEAYVFQDIHKEMVIFLFAIGAALGGGVGALVGKTIGEKANAKISQSDVYEERTFETAMTRWEEFVGLLAAEADTLSTMIEENQSKATMI